MEIWTHSDRSAWERWQCPALGLDAVASAGQALDQVVVVGTGPDDDDQTLAAIRLTRRLASKAVMLVAGSVHPTAAWSEVVRQAGADRVVLVPDLAQLVRPEQPTRLNVVELDAALCPALHVQGAPGIALSVCGRHRDRMVLARQHLERWCLRARADCPHWLGGDETEGLAPSLPRSG